jgi:hypothetical protein
MLSDLSIADRNATYNFQGVTVTFPNWSVTPHQTTKPPRHPDPRPYRHHRRADKSRSGWVGEGKEQNGNGPTVAQLSTRLGSKR